jgi:uncharacterized protein YyaL (SSP411 family)
VGDWVSIGAAALFGLGPGLAADAGANMSEIESNVTSTSADRERADELAAARPGRRSPAEIRKQGNGLVGQRSLYLQQHAHNPVDWQPWSTEALERARRQDKPIFLSIGYSSCHWCHVMEREVFEHDGVAELLNAHFIAIKVDREERPDLDQVYMEAVIAMTGGGGWPMSVFATPDGRPFFGGTYFPRPQFEQLLVKLAATYRDQREQIEALGGRLAGHLAAEVPLEEGGKFDPQWFGQASETAKRQFDPRWGGFAARMKFPMPVRWSYLLEYFRKTADPQLEPVLRITLDQMGSGGLHDHVGGGFHRYTVEETWLVPHFEKMLYDNALLASLYLRAAAVFDHPRYREIARDTLDFLIGTMADPGGGIYASLDADSGGVEGSYYVWTPAEIQQVAGPRDGPALAALLGVTEAGNFEGKSVLTRRVEAAELASRLDRDPLELDELFVRYRPALLATREQRARPGLDRKIVTSWNGLAIGALAQGYRLLGDERYLEAATRTADFLLRVHRRADGSLARVSNGGVAEHAGVLDDYAFLSMGLLELYQANGSHRFLQAALGLIGHAIEHFRHPRAGFYLSDRSQAAPLGRQVEIADGVRPSGNAILVQALLAAAALTGRDDLRALAEADLDAFSGALGKFGLETAGWYSAALRRAGPYYDVVVAGDPADEKTRALLAVCDRLLPSQAVLVRLAAQGPDRQTLALQPSLAGKRALKGQSTAFVCRHGACRLPTSDPLVFRTQILEGWKH